MFQCRYKECKCQKCELVVERQNLMARQIKERRRQKKQKESNDDGLRSEQEQQQQQCSQNNVVHNEQQQQVLTADATCNWINAVMSAATSTSRISTIVDYEPSTIDYRRLQDDEASIGVDFSCKQFTHTYPYQSVAI